MSFIVAFAVILLSLILSALLAQASKNSSKNHAYPGRLPLFGHQFLVSAAAEKLQLHVLFSHMASHDKNGVVLFDMPLLSAYGALTQRADLISQIFKRTSDFVRGDTFQTMATGITKYSLALLQTDGHSNDVWKKHRKQLQPAFGPQNLRYGFESTIRVIDSLNKSWKNMDTSRINIHDHFTLVALDVIGLVAFSHEFNLSGNIEDQKSARFSFLNHARELFTAMGKRYGPEFVWSSLGVSVAQMKPHVDAVNALVNDIIAEKKSSAKPRDKASFDLVDRLLQDGVFTDSEIRDEVFGFFLAGLDTTANLMTYCAFELAKNPLSLQKLRTSLDELWAKKPAFDMESLMNNKYLDGFVKETLRLHPPTPILMKTAARDCELDGVLIKKGTDVFPIMSSTHRDPRYWSDPESFRPERWTADFVPVEGSYLPFGDGSTNCIGQKLALIETKITIASLVREWDIELSPNQNFKQVWSVTMGFKDGLFVGLKKRC